MCIKQRIYQAEDARADFSFYEDPFKDIYSCLLGAIILVCNSPVTLTFLQRNIPSHISDDITGSYNQL